jgi:hypothetical protein
MKALNRTSFRTRRRSFLTMLVAAAGLSVVAGTVPGPAGATPAPTCNGTTCTVTFDYTGGVQTWTVPAAVTSATFDVDGAAGGSLAAVGLLVGGAGGKGGHVQATVALTPGDTLNLRVGGQGEDGLLSPKPFSGTLTVAGGFNGGGTNSFTCPSNCVFALGGAGGGASDVRTAGDGLADRLLVAGGGGGAGIGGDPGQPGDGGGSATAAPSVTSTFFERTCSGGGAGTLLGPGAAGAGFSCFSGNAGNGADGGDGVAGVGAGGGGYFGGGAGAQGIFRSPGSGGGGGSDYPDPANPPAGVSAVTVAHGVHSGNGLITITYTLSAAQAITDLQGLVSGLGLTKGLTTALNSKLNDALAALAADDTAGACDSLQAFLNQVKAQTGKKLTSDQAQQLTDAANDIRDQLGC